MGTISSTWSRVRAGPAGIHLFDRATGVNVLIDEVRVPTSLWSRAPRQVSIALTNSCDLHCQFCYAPKTAATLKCETVISWLKEIDANGCVGIGFGGGEPTLHPHLTRICRAAADSTAMAVTLTTHAHRLDEALAADLRGTVHFVRVSMDGVGFTYERIRGRPFEELLRRLDLVRHLAPFGINYVVNDQTVLDLDSAVATAAMCGASEFLLLPEHSVRGKGGITANASLALHNWVSSYCGPVRLSVSESGAAGLPTCDALAAETGLRAYAHIDASGVLKRTSYDGAGVPIARAGVMSALQELEQCAEDDR